MNYEEAHRNSLHEFIFPLITCNLNNFQALYRFSNKSYHKNETDYGENFRLLAANAIVFAIVLQVLFRIPLHMQSCFIGLNSESLCFRYNSQHTKQHGSIITCFFPAMSSRIRVNCFLLAR